MSVLNLSKIDITASDGTPVRLIYDQEADILEIFFGANEPATGVDLTDHIVLRLNQQTKCAISLMLLDFSILTERTEYGPRSYPLDKLNDLPEDLCELVLRLITSRLRRPNRHFAGDQLLGSECRCCLFDARWPCIFNG